MWSITVLPGLLLFEWRIILTRYMTKCHSVMLGIYIYRPWWRRSIDVDCWTTVVRFEYGDLIINWYSCTLTRWISSSLWVASLFRSHTVVGFFTPHLQITDTRLSVCWWSVLVFRHTSQYLGYISCTRIRCSLNENGASLNRSTNKS